jgi:hypothetical protein
MRKQGIYTAPSSTYIPPSYGPAYGGSGATGGSYAASGGYGYGMQQQPSQKRTYWKPKKTGYGKLNKRINNFLFFYNKLSTFSTQL